MIRISFMKQISLLLVLCLLICCVACSAEVVPPANNSAPSVSVSSNETTSTAVIENTTTVSATQTVPTTTYTTTVQTTVTTVIIATTTKRTEPRPMDGSEASGTTKDGFKWTRFIDLRFTVVSSKWCEWWNLTDSFTEIFGSTKSVAVSVESISARQRVIIPETIEGYPVVRVGLRCNKKAVKEVVLPKYMLVCSSNSFPYATDFYMPEEFISGNLPSGMDEWPEKGMTYHIPAASPLAAQLREKLTAAGVSHDLLTEGAIGVLDLSGVDAIDADGKLSFE